MPGTIQRIFYIHEAGQQPRAGHRHHKAWNALTCLSGSCRVYVHDGQEEKTVWLDDPRQCLVLEPADWHVVDAFSAQAVLLVVSNEPYDPADYIHEPYANCHWPNLGALIDSE